MNHKQPYGVLILHGFTSSLDTVNGLVPPIEALGLPYRMPVLRGHGEESPEALRHVTWRDWMEDAENALNDLLQEVEQVILCGFSMGGVIVIILAADYGAKVDSVIAAAPGIKVYSPLGPGRPLAFLRPIVSRVLKNWDFPAVYTDPELAQYDTNYRWAPMDAVLSYLELSQIGAQRLPEIEQPILILHGRNDTSAHPDSVEIIYQSVATPEEDKHVVWFEGSNHLLFRDCDREAAIQAVADYIKERVGAPV